MKDEKKTKAQLIAELEALRARVAKLESLEAERKLTEEALRESEKEFRNIIESLPMGVHMYQLEPDGKLCFIGANPAADKILGVDNKQYIGKTIYEAFPKISETEIPEKFRKIAEKGGFWKKEDIVYKDELIEGVFENYNFQTSPGKMVSLFIDISGRKRAEEELRSSREQMRNLSTYLQSVREKERTHISREIHDELGQALTALKMDLSWLGNRLPEEQKSLLEKTKTMEKLIDMTIHSVQRISAELRPGVLDDLGLMAAIEWQVEEFKNRTGIKCEVSLEPEDIILDRERSTTIFRILQETLTNVVRHSKATRIKVSLKEKAGNLVLKVRDNGKGITEKQISNPKSVGLIGIRERAHFWGGKVKISGVKDKGTIVTVSVPLNKKERLDDKNTHR